MAFSSGATNLVAGDTNGAKDIFVRDRQLGVTERVSVDSGGAQANSDSDAPVLSRDGRYVTFVSIAGNLVPGDTNGWHDVFLRDRQLGTTERVSVASSGIQGNGSSTFSSISDDGNLVAFMSRASNFVSPDVNDDPDIFVRDRAAGTTTCVNVTPGGVPSNIYSDGAPTISADGRYVAFGSNSTNLVPVNGSGQITHIFVRDRHLGLTELVSVDSGGAQGNASSTNTHMSADGRYVVFKSGATNLVAGDTNATDDIFLRDRQMGTTERVSVNSGGWQANGGSTTSEVSADGRHVAFYCFATNLVFGDTNGVPDVFVRDRFGVPSFTSLCDPGVGGVIACPCSNPPSGSGRGCNNSSNTGGAMLSASGGTSLSSDSLVFTTSGEKPTALSIVAQWDGVNATGVAFGQGVRCTSGNLKRLFAKSAVSGSITAPNFAGGDASVSATSLAKGDPISVGQSRWYVVYYRDNTVLGACPPLTNFNATQTGRVVWEP